MGKIHLGEDRKLDPVVGELVACVHLTRTLLPARIMPRAENAKAFLVPISDLKCIVPVEKSIVCVVLLNDYVVRHKVNSAEKLFANNEGRHGETIKQVEKCRNGKTGRARRFELEMRKEGQSFRPVLLFERKT